MLQEEKQEWTKNEKDVSYIYGLYVEGGLYVGVGGGEGTSTSKICLDETCCHV